MAHDEFVSFISCNQLNWRRECTKLGAIIGVNKLKDLLIINRACANVTIDYWPVPRDLKSDSEIINFSTVSSAEPKTGEIL